MPNSPPRLDDRGFDDLVAELLARIPAHTPEWTDPRVGDPGRALIELFAWLGDTLLYRANLIPERQRLVFLKLLGMQVLPAIAAQGIVTIAIDSEGPVEPVTLRSGARIDGPPTFETRSELTVLPIEGRVYAKQLLSEDDAKQLAGVVGDLMDLFRALRPDAQSGNQAPVGYTTREVFPQGAPARSGFDLVADTADKALWIALLAPTPALVASTRAGLIAGASGRPFTLGLGIVPALAPIGTLDELPVRLPRRMVLEVMTNERAGARYVFSELDIASDSTSGFTRDGVLQAGLAVGSFGVPSNDVIDSPSAGMGDLPPRIDSAEDAARLIGWLRLRPAEALTSLPLTWMGINAVEIDHVRTLENVIVGVGNGRPDQVLSLPARNVDPSTIELQVLEDAGWTSWRRVDDLVAYGRDDRVFVLESEAGSARFGDGLRGQLVANGARVRVTKMRAGGGVTGNLPPGSLTQVQGENADGDPITTPLVVGQRLATRGGVDAENLAVAERRIPATLRHRNRAVTDGDFRSLAATTPGLRVGRVELLPRFKPQQRRQNVGGVITVMGIPSSTTPGFRPPAPRPDRHFVETMYARLDERRLLGTELYVIGPEYVPLSAAVGIDVRQGFGVEQTIAAVRLALRAFFWPLAPGGPGGRGWPLGNTVVTSHAEIAIARVPGVSALRGVRLFDRDGTEWRELPAANGRQLLLSAWQLPELLHVVVVVGRDAPTEISEAPNPFLDGNVEAIPIPIVPEVC